MKTLLKIIAVIGVAVPAIATASLAGEAISDLGQKLQFQLTEANSVYTRSSQAKSNIAAKYDKTADALVQNIRG